MALRELDPIWTACAGALGVPIARTAAATDGYVHFDGRVLHVAADEHLDADDSLAQLVLHELCHLLVQGPASRTAPDWGLDNTGAPDAAFDEVRERAAVRLQAHLSGAFGLRRHFFPTTVVRPFYEALPADALEAERDDGSAALARAAATRAGRDPYRAAIGAALQASAFRLGVPLHRSGAALEPAVRCGGCAWRAASGLCRAGDRRVFVSAAELGCARREEALDCLACGACCRSGYDAVPAGARAIVARRHPHLVVARGDGYDLRRAVVDGEDRCAALEGPGAGPYRCTVYDDRPRACADLPVGGAACLQARRRVGRSFA